MAIKQVQDRYKPGRGMMPIGKIAKGAPKGEKGFGADLDYFRLKVNASLPAHEQRDIEAIFAEMYGDKPSILAGCFLLSAAVDEALSAWYEHWGKNKHLHRRCDGEQQTEWFDPALGAMNRNPIACARDSAKPCQCKQVARVSLWMPAFTLNSGVFGYFTLETHSIRDIAKMYATLRDIESAGGILNKIPFTLSREPDSWKQPELDRQTGKPTGNQITVTKSMVFLRPAREYVSLMAERQLGAVREVYGALPEGTRALPAGDGDRWTEAQAVAWANAIHKDVGMSKAQILAALGVNGLGEWAGDAVSATIRINAYLNAQDQGDNPLMG